MRRVKGKKKKGKVNLIQVSTEFSASFYVVFYSLLLLFFLLVILSSLCHLRRDRRVNNTSNESVVFSSFLFLSFLLSKCSLT